MIKDLLLRHNITEHYFRLHGVDCCAPLYPQGQTFGHLALRHHKEHSTLSTTVGTDVALCELLCFLDIFFAVKVDPDPLDCLPYEKVVSRHKQYFELCDELVCNLIADRSVCLHWGVEVNQANYQYTIIPTTYSGYVGLEPHH